MLTLAAIKENPQEIVRRLAVKHFDAEKLINEILELDQARRKPVLTKTAPTSTNSPHRSER